MGKRILVSICVFIVLIILVSVSAYAQVKFKWGSGFEIRHEYWKNLFDVDNDGLDNINFFKVRSSPWGQVDFNKDVSIFAKLTNEFAAYTYYAPLAFKPQGKNDKSYHFDIDEVVFDNLYLDVKNLLGLPLDLRLGRQNFFEYGEGFLIWDGTPQDTCRTAYFNALKLALRMDDQNNLDFIYLNDPRDDIYLPVINENKAPYNLNTTDEEGYILYWKNNKINNLALENYYIYKREDEDGGAGLQAEKGKINTFGSFARYSLSPWTFRGQFAYQFGTYGNKDRRAFGGYGYIDRNFKDFFWSPQATTGFVYLSGDKQGSSKNEAWDPLFSRWPMMISDLYPATIDSDTNVGILGYWTNVQIYRTGVGLSPTSKTKLSLWYNLLRANAQVATSAICSGTGKKRGDLLQTKIEYTFNKNIAAYFAVEYLLPGNFYRDSDKALFVKTDVTLTF